MISLEVRASNSGRIFSNCASFAMIPHALRPIRSDTLKRPSPSGPLVNGVLGRGGLIFNVQSNGQRVLQV